MKNKDLAQALLKGEEPIDVQALTVAVLRRDRRRIWFAGIACVVAWMLVVMLPWATILPMLAKVVSFQAEFTQSATPSSAEQREQSLLVAQIVKHGTIATFIGSLASMFCAALCTVFLILFSRRATLRQVNVRLAEISAQIKAQTKESK